MIRQVFSALTALAIIGGFVSPVHANPSAIVTDQSTLNAHGQLLDTVASTGVRVYINPAQCLKRPGINGFYISQAGVLAICQDNGKGDGNMVEWTNNDLDTIRHETHHLVQDCKVKRGDGVLDQLFTDNLEGVLRNSSLTEKDIIGIMSSYLERGATTDVVELELEAFAVAADIPAETIGEAVERLCVR